MATDVIGSTKRVLTIVVPVDELGGADPAGAEPLTRAAIRWRLRRARLRPRTSADDQPTYASS